MGFLDDMKTKWIQATVVNFIPMFFDHLWELAAQAVDETTDWILETIPQGFRDTAARFLGDKVATTLEGKVWGEKLDNLFQKIGSLPELQEFKAATKALVTK